MRTLGVRRLKVILLLSSLAFLTFLLLAAFEENFTAEWRTHQAAYADQIARLSASSGATGVAYPLEIRQTYLEGLNKVDRCVTCHVAIDDPRFPEAAQPLTTHPGDILTHHPSDKFGCTICHQGQGRATMLPDAHGLVAHWPEPLHQGAMVYTSCGRCHYENDLFGGQSDLYGQVTPIEHVSQGELTAGLPGADNIARGKRLVVEHGCLGCHKYRGRGGSLGPDITYVGNKTAHDFDFRQIAHQVEERTVESWMFAHFKSPEAVIPTTIMPDMQLSDAAAHDLAAYMISLKRKSAPAAYTPLPQPVDPTPVRGETLYAMYCSACHGRDGIGAVARDPEAARRTDWPRELITPSLRNNDTLAVASDDYLHRIIADGRTGTSMPAWSTVGGLSADEIDLLVSFIRRWELPSADRTLISASRGNPRYGAALFRANCRGCHGADGEGGPIGVSLRSPGFLALASDALLTETILNGRANTAMPSWRQFDNREVSDLLAFIRSWQPLRSDRAAVLSAAAWADQPPSEERVAIGRKLFRSRCSVCHGEDGEGTIGPSLNNQSVLRVASNEFLHDTLVEGRPGTAMPAWRQLSTDDVVDLLALFRSWQTQPAQDLPDLHVAGDWQNGALLYAGMCASCHGPDVEGAIGPQLSNPVFLRTASDAMLVEWISHGRTGTPMRPNLKGAQGTAELTRTQIEDVVTFLRYRGARGESGGQQIGLGFAPRGREHYDRMCAGCHGLKGEGTIGPAIGNPEFLRVASDGFLRGTIVLGRDGTEMRSMGHGGSGIVELRADQIDDLIAYLRNLPDHPLIPHRFVIGADADRGRELYAQQCAGCHGVEGKGLAGAENKRFDFAPHLNNPDFLRAATDGFLQATIIRGRRGTAMRPFGRGGHGLAELSQEQINDIVAYIRQWSPETRPLRRTEPFPDRHPIAIEGTAAPRDAGPPAPTIPPPRRTLGALQ